jgi:hypothetical protein
MKRSLLESAFKEKTLIGIRTNAQDWGESIIGFIVKLEDLFFTINEIDEYGAYIGNTTIEIENIINIDINSRYEKRLKFINEYISTINPNNRTTIWKEGKLLIPHFNNLIVNETIVTFWFNEDDYVIGLLLKFDEDDILIKNIGREGDEDGISCHYINKLIGIRYNGLEEQKIKLLYDNRVLFYSPPG